MQKLVKCELPILLKASWQAAVLIVLVLLAQWALGRRLKPRWRYGLWLLVMLRLALPWTVPSAVSVFNLLRFSKASEAVVNQQATPGAQGSLILQSTATAPAMAAFTAAAPWFRVGLFWLPLVWAAGV